METAHRKTKVTMVVKWPEHVQDRPKRMVIVEKAKTLPEL
jgi:hypothetical protein